MRLFSSRHAARSGYNLKAARKTARINAASAIDQLDTPRHPIVERTIAALEKAKPDERGLVRSERAGCIVVAVSPASIERVSVALDRLIAAAAVQGFAPAKSEAGVVFSGHEISVSFSIQETVRRVKHELTEAELAEEERHKKKLRPNEWHSSFLFRNRFPEWDYIPTGQLAVELEDIFYAGGAPRRNFRDGKTQTVESMAEDIAVGLVVFAAAKKEKVQRDRERAEQAELERQRRQDAERRRHISDRRYKEMVAVLADAEEASRLQSLVQHLQSDMSPHKHPRVAEFIDWAEAYVAMLSERLSPARLDERFVEKRVFGPDDDFNFYPSRW